MTSQYRTIHAKDVAHFQAEIAKGTILISFSADRCQPCQEVAPMLDELAAEQAGRIKVISVDVDKKKFAPLIDTYRVNGIPTVILLKEGEVSAKLLGNIYKKKLLSLLA